MRRRAIAGASRPLVFHGGGLALALLCAGTLGAQDDFEAFKRREAERLREFISKDDAAFADFLKREWKDYSLSLAGKPLVRPKPVARPVAPPVSAPAAPPSSAEPRPVTPAGNVAAPPPAAATPEPVPVPAAGARDMPLPRAAPALTAAPVAAPILGPIRAAASVSPSTAGVLNAAYYGAVVSVPAIELNLRPLPAVITREALAAFWEQISAAPTARILTALGRYREQMALPDWPYAHLVYATALAMAKGDTTTARLIAWHLLVKSGYAVRIGFGGSKIHLLVKSEEMLYGVSFFTTNQGRFFALDPAGGPPPDVGAIRTYDGDHPDAKSGLVFQMGALPNLLAERQPRTVRFTYGAETFGFEVGINRNLVNLLANYPQTTLQGYLDADLDSPAMEELEAGLARIVAGRTEREAVEIILRFVQTAFEYKTDGEQFRREKWMFPEETLFYPYSDCEDRAILFAHLARKLVRVRVVGLIYADHVATAIRFSTEVPGDARMHRGERYVVADPTYVNARVGMEMPQYRQVSPPPRVVEARSLPPN